MHGFLRGHVAADDRQLGIQPAQLFHHLQHALAVAVRGIDHQHVHARRDKRRRAFERIVRDAYRRAAEQAAVFVLGAVRILDGLFDILGRNQADEVIVFIDERQLFDAVPRQNALGLFQAGARRRGDEIFARHHLGDRLILMHLKAKVAVGEDAHEPSIARDGHAGNVIAAHQGERVAHFMFG